KPHAPSARALQLQLDVDEVVWRPRPGVLERQQIIVAMTDLTHALVELLGASPLDEEGRIHDHAIANDLVAPTRDGDRLERIVHVGDEAIAGLFEGGLDEPAELHAGEVGRGTGVVRDLVLEPPNLVILLLEIRDDLLAIPQDLEPE